MAAGILPDKFANLAMAQMNVMRGCINEVDARLAEHSQNQQQLNAALDNSLKELTACYIPDLKPEALESVLPLTGYGKFQGLDAAQIAEQTRSQRLARIAAIEADPSFIARDKLIDPVVGELTLKRQDTQQELDTIAGPLARFAQSDDFMSLYRRGYDTDHYSEHWWNWAYYKDRSAVDRVLTQFSGEPGGRSVATHDAGSAHATFHEITGDYQRLLAARETITNSLKSIDDKIAFVQSLVDEREGWVNSLDGIESDLLNQFRRQLEDHLQYMDRADLAAKAAGKDAVLGLLKRLQGIEKKQEYLNDLATNMLKPERDRLINSMTKLQTRTEKYLRPRNRNIPIPAAQADALLADPRPRLQRRFTSYNTVYHRVYVFDSYDRYDFAADLLWWHYMAGASGSFQYIPEAVGWNQIHPEGYAAYAADQDAAMAASVDDNVDSNASASGDVS